MTRVSYIGSPMPPRAPNDRNQVGWDPRIWGGGGGQSTRTTQKSQLRILTLMRWSFFLLEANWVTKYLPALTRVAEIVLQPVKTLGYLKRKQNFLGYLKNKKKYISSALKLVTHTIFVNSSFLVSQILTKTFYRRNEIRIKNKPKLGYKF